MLGKCRGGSITLSVSVGMKAPLPSEWTVITPTVCSVAIGPYAGMFELWLDEDGYYTKVLNPSASELFGDQVFGGRLHGVVMVIGCKDGPP